MVFGLAVLTASLAAQKDATVRGIEERAAALRKVHAVRLVEVGKRCLADPELLTAASAAREAALLLDPAAAVELALPPPPAEPRQHGGRWVGIVQVVEGIRDGLPVDDKQLAKLRQLDPLLADLAREHDDAAQALAALVGEYRSIAENERAFELALLCHDLCRPRIRDAFRELDQILAAKRYEAEAREHLTAFRGANDKIGRLKKWQFSGMTIEVPGPDERDATIVSRKGRSGDYVLEADVQFAAVKGRIALIAVWIDSKNYCALDYERDNHAVLRLVHCDNGERRDLAVTTLKQKTFDEYFRLRVEVADGRISTDIGAGPCSAALPIPVGDEVRYGLQRPGLGRKAEKKDDELVIRVRNFVVR